MRKNTLLYLFAILISIASISTIILLFLSKKCKCKNKKRKPIPITDGIIYNDISVCEDKTEKEENNNQNDQLENQMHFVETPNDENTQDCSNVNDSESKV